ncbi:GNA1162 family protein [Treponema pectinovorum]|uniref:GNA1162 family protein n=1 Tax=Treponema pectinovorum TaxID=164 RepID=UPI0011F3E4FD|nr:GNA1162 family protein [Treponema pectinovorum]
MKKSIIICFAAVCAAFMLNSCATTTKSAEFAAMYSEKPQVMLIMPPINNTSNVEAKDFFYTTMNVPIAEAGYYVLPPAACYSVMQRESAYDAERFIDGDLKKFRQLFGADVCIFTIIKSWTKSYVGSSVTVEIEYRFKSTKTNEVLYVRDATLVCDTSSNTKVGGFGLIGALVNVAADAIKTATTDYVEVAKMCNNNAISDLPVGKYRSNYGADGGESAMPKKIHRSLKK